MAMGICLHRLSGDGRLIIMVHSTHLSDWWRGRQEYQNPGSGTWKWNEIEVSLIGSSSIGLDEGMYLTVSVTFDIKFDWNKR
jgi:hypothetical protein